MSDDQMKERFEKFYLAALTGILALRSRTPHSDLDDPRADAEKAFTYAQYAIQVMDGKWESGQALRDWDRRRIQKAKSEEAMNRIAELDEEMGL